MIHPPIIVDTNVLVSALLTIDTRSPVATVLDGMLSAAFGFVVSDVCWTADPWPDASWPLQYSSLASHLLAAVERRPVGPAALTEP